MNNARDGRYVFCSLNDGCKMPSSQFMSSVQLATCRFQSKNWESTKLLPLRLAFGVLTWHHILLLPALCDQDILMGNKSSLDLQSQSFSISRISRTMYAPTANQEPHSGITHMCTSLLCATHLTMSYLSFLRATYMHLIVDPKYPTEALLIGLRP